VISDMHFADLEGFKANENYYIFQAISFETANIKLVLDF
jgi:hypothetical protein